MLKIMISNQVSLEAKAKRLIQSIIERDSGQDWPKTDLAYSRGQCYECDEPHWSLSEGGLCDRCKEARASDDRNYQELEKRKTELEVQALEQKLHTSSK